MTENYKKLAVLGHPIQQSASPLIHNHWIDQYGMSGSYEAIDIPCEELEEHFRQLIAQGYKGFNITVPHKQTIMSLCDEIDSSAQNIGAVNTVVVHEDGQIEGHNTDAFGFIENLKAHETELKIKGSSVVMIGAGGAARAVAYGLLQEGAGQIKIVNRTQQKALALQNMNPEKMTIGHWDERAQELSNADLVVNTTSLGMNGQPPLDLDLGDLPGHAVVCDIVYKPLYTELLQQAQSRGNPVVTGIGMLLQQARPAFQAWFGVMPEINDNLHRLVMP